LTTAFHQKTEIVMRFTGRGGCLCSAEMWWAHTVSKEAICCVFQWLCRSKARDLAGGQQRRYSHSVTYQIVSAGIMVTGCPAD